MHSNTQTTKNEIAMTAKEYFDLHIKEVVEMGDIVRTD
jgi:hypothetical protein